MNEQYIEDEMIANPCPATVAYWRSQFQDDGAHPDWLCGLIDVRNGGAVAHMGAALNCMFAEDWNSQRDSHIMNAAHSGDGYQQA